MSNPAHELVLTRIIDAPREKLFHCYTDPKLLQKWFVPRPWTIAAVDIDVRPGGLFSATMKDPDGKEYPNLGVYLEVVENERIVTTDAFLPGWIPTGAPFMVAHVTFEDAGPGKTRYTARAMHWTAENRETHEKMGFHEGWGQCAAQLEELAKTL